jgi:hypothetical protein
MVDSHYCCSTDGAGNPRVAVCCAGELENETGVHFVRVVNAGNGGVLLTNAPDLFEQRLCLRSGPQNNFT